MQENDIHLYHKLLTLPLFQGLSRSDLETIVGHIKFEFRRFHAGETVIEAGRPCSSLFFLLSGSLTIRTQADDHSYELSEHMALPDILQPEHLFGLSQRFTKTFTAEEKSYLMVLDKQEIMKLSDDYTIFRINLLNIISTRCQRCQHHPLRHTIDDLKERIVRFVSDRCTRPAGPMELRIKMEQLAHELNASRLNVSRALNVMQRQGLLQLKRGFIIIPAFEHLTQNIYPQ